MAKKDPIDQVLDLVRETTSFDASWQKVLTLCRKCKKSYIWERLPHPNFEADVEHARSWLKAEMPVARPAYGIYLGLDTLNMERSHQNLEIAFSSNVDPAKPSMKFLSSLKDYGEKHLIRSLLPMKRVYENSEVHSNADYTLFLGYSGLVLLAAFERSEISKDLLVVWGFHDGDLFFLLRQVNGKQERLVCVGE